jgi:hypothetical protein
MKTFTSICRFLLLVLGIGAVLAASSTAQTAEPQGAARGLWGDWELKIKFEEREMDAIASFSRDQEGNLTGEWISFWGITPLKDIKYENGKLSFVQVVRFRDEEFRSTFSGVLEDGKLTGTLSSERGDSAVEGRRLPRIPRVVGTWNLKYRVGDQNVEAALVIKADKEGRLSAEWKAASEESEVSEVDYQRGTLTLKRKVKTPDRQIDSAFEAAIDRETGLLKGTLKSEKGEIPVEGKRFGEALIGSWDLDIVTEQGPYRQRLRVNPDLSGLYGTLPIEKIDFADGKVSFKVQRQFGDRSFELSFDGQLSDSKLTGKITTPRGTQTVEGRKIVRPFMRPRGAGTN